MKNTIITSECIDITVDFYGVCKYEGLVIFVKGMIPGEIANIKIIKVKNKIAYGIIQELIKKSEYRVKESCPISYKCGGCDLQYIEYNHQLSLKKKLIENTIYNNKLDIKVLEPIPSDDKFNYRNKIQVPVSNNKIGYYRNHSNDIVEFENCLITDDTINSIFKEIRSYIIEYSMSDLIRHIVLRKSSSGIMICLVVKTFDIPLIDDLIIKIKNSYKDIKSIMLNLNNKDTNVIFGDTDKCLYGDEYIVDRVSNLSFMIPLRSFYQINSKQMLKLYDLVIEKANLSKTDNVLDLFCGIGTISLYISKYVNKVLGIEIVDKSIEYANKNKSLNSIDNVEFIKTDANIINDFIKNYNVIVLDPPRKGVDSNLISSIINSDINKVVYISCNQATLVRDLVLFKDFFDISDIQPVDMFPQTKHIECVVLLNRKV